MVKELDYCDSKTKGFISIMTKTCLGSIRDTNCSHRSRPHFVVTCYTSLGEIQSLLKRTGMKGSIKTFACTKKIWARLHYPDCSHEIREIAVALKSWAVPSAGPWTAGPGGRPSYSPVSMFKSQSEHPLKQCVPGYSVEQQHPSLL